MYGQGYLIPLFETSLYIKNSNLISTEGKENLLLLTLHATDGFSPFCLSNYFLMLRGKYIGTFW